MACFTAFPPSDLLLEVIVRQGQAEVRLPHPFQRLQFGERAMLCSRLRVYHVYFFVNGHGGGGGGVF